jgi:DNA-binding LytR/AlgR family response regulator
MQSTVPLPLIQDSVLANAIGNANESAPKPESSRKTFLPLKTLIVVRDEDTAFRLRVLFRSDPRFEVVSDCVSELEVLSVIERADLDAMVIDLNLPQLGSKAFLGAINQLGRVLFVLDPEPRLERLLQNKGLLYLCRDSDPAQFHLVADRLVESSGARFRAGAQSLIRLLSGKYRARSSRLAIRVAKRLLVLDQGEIYSVETDGKNTWIHLALESHKIGESFSEVARRLDRNRLFKISRRVLVNVTHIKEIMVEPLEGCSVRLYNDHSYRLPLRNASRIRSVVEALCKP